MNYGIVYDFEGQIEPAVAKFYKDAGLIAYTCQGRLEDDGSISVPDVQKDRPRVELMLTPGAGRMQWHLINDSDDPQSAVESLWNATMSVELITEADAKIHQAFLCIVRGVSSIIQGVNGVTLLYHKIHGPIRYGGESHGYDAEKGYFITRSNLIFDFSIHADGWALLTA